jgi:hypothetical protein
MGHETGEDEILAADCIKACLKIRAGKRIGQPFLNDGLGRQWRQGGNYLPALGTTIEQAAGTSLVRNMDDRSAARPCRCQEPRGIGNCCIGVRHGDRAIKVLVLQVDQDETGIGYLGGRKIGASKLKQGFGRSDPPFSCDRGRKIAVAGVRSVHSGYWHSGSAISQHNGMDNSGPHSSHDSDYLCPRFYVRRDH